MIDADRKWTTPAGSAIVLNWKNANVLDFEDNIEYQFQPRAVPYESEVQLTEAD